MTHERYLIYATQGLIFAASCAVLWWAFLFGHTTKRSALAVAVAFASLAALTAVILFSPAGVWLVVAVCYAVVSTLAISAVWLITLHRRAREKAGAVFQ